MSSDVNRFFLLSSGAVSLFLPAAMQECGWQSGVSLQFIFGRVTFFLKKSKECIIFNIILVDFIEICDLLRISRVYR